MNIPKVKIIDSVSSGQIDMEGIELLWIDKKLYKIVPLTPTKKGIYRPVISGRKYSVSYEDTKTDKTIKKDPKREELKNDQDQDIFKFIDLNF